MTRCRYRHFAKFIPFQLTRSRGAWRSLRVQALTHRRFQLTRSRGAWQTEKLWIVSLQNFNSHAHVERDDNQRSIQQSQDRFQLTRSRGAWLSALNTMLILGIFQLTRSRGAWLLSVLQWGRSWQFQLTRSRGAWLRSAANGLPHMHFNSHAHVERD